MSPGIRPLTSSARAQGALMGMYAASRPDPKAPLISHSPRKKARLVHRVRMSAEGGRFRIVTAPDPSVRSVHVRYRDSPRSGRGLTANLRGSSRREVSERGLTSSCGSGSIMAPATQAGVRTAAR